MTEKEDDHNEQKNGGVAHLPAATAPVDEVVDENSQVQETEEHQWKNTKNHKSKKKTINKYCYCCATL